MEYIDKVTSATTSPHALYQARSNRHSFVAKIDSGASHNCISKTSASAYRIVMAPFSMRTPKNVTTRHKKRKSSTSKMVPINEIADNLTSKAENPSATSLGASSSNDSMKVIN